MKGVGKLLFYRQITRLKLWAAGGQPHRYRRSKQARRSYRHPPAAAPRKNSSPSSSVNFFRARSPPRWLRGSMPSPRRIRPCPVRAKEIERSAGFWYAARAHDEEDLYFAESENSRRFIAEKFSGTRRSPSRILLRSRLR
jgi:hypothetical protein